jgi:hypothetical protein
MNNGRENRTNGNQEKGKEEKEALRKSVRVKKGTPKASPKFLCRSFCSAALSMIFSISVRRIRGSLRQVRHSLLSLGAQSAKGAEVAMEIDLRVEVAVCDSAGDGEHSLSRLF